MRVSAAALAAALTVLVCGEAAWPEPFELRTRTVDLHTEDNTIDRVGKLQYRGGLELTSPDPRFGGLSGLAVSPDGSRLSAVTDNGSWIVLAPALSPAGRLTGIKAAEIGALRDLDGKPLGRKRDSDAEALIRIDGGFAVAFEGRHRLWLYRGAPNPFLARPKAIALPTFARAMPGNGGLEGLARLSDGRLIAIAEKFPEDTDYSQGWIIEDAGWRGFRYRRHAPFFPTGAEPLPDGAILVLERRFSLIGGVGTRLVEVSAALIKPNAEVTGRQLARFERPLVTENFEGVASYRNAAGEVIVYLISDDNFHMLLRTLLLCFALER